MFEVTGVQFFNTSRLTIRLLLDDPNNISDQLLAYLNGFSAEARDVLEKFDFREQVRRLERSNLMYQVISRFCDIDLYPDKVSNLQMAYLYEELIRRFSELSNEEAGAHFTPREVRGLYNVSFAARLDLRSNLVLGPGV